MVKIAVFVSGNGSNLQALMDAEDHGLIPEGKIVLVVSDKKDAYALKRAEERGIATFVLEKTGFSSREDYDKVILGRLREEGIDLVVLAGFMRILSSCFVHAYSDRILNIHPALLPDFKGASAIKDAYEARVKKTGVTVHFVTEELDSGPAILQEKVEVLNGDTLDSLEERIHRVEHRLYPEAVRLFTEGKLELKDGKVNIKK